MPIHQDTSPCPICGSRDADHRTSNHHIQRVNAEGEPLAFVISAQRVYDDQGHKARLMALARQELRQYFPGKTFEIQPAKFTMLRNRKDNDGPILGTSYVSTYIAYEM